MHSTQNAVTYARSSSGTDQMRSLGNSPVLDACEKTKLNASKNLSQRILRLTGRVAAQKPCKTYE